MATKIIGKVSIVPYGDWQENTTYPRLAVVGYQGGSYIAVVENTNITPIDTSSWKQIAAAGNGISSIEKISTVGLVDTYRITYTNDDYFDYTVNNGATKTSELINDSGFIDKDVNNLTNYLLKTDTGATIEITYNSSAYTVTANLKNSSGTVISTSTLQLPSGSSVVDASYDEGTYIITLTQRDGTTITLDLSNDFNAKEDIANKTDELNGNSTEDEYPNAQITYEKVHELQEQGVSQEAQGQEIFLYDATNLPPKEIEILGNATQDGTPTPDTPQDIHVVTGDNTVCIKDKYIPIEYLESTGTQYIDTGVKAKGNSTNFDITYQIAQFPTDSGIGILGSWETNKQFRTFWSLSGNGLRMQYYNGSNNVTGGNNTDVHNIKLTDGKYYLDDRRDLTLTLANFEATLSMYMFATHSSNVEWSHNGKLRIYSCKIYDGNTLVRDFIPVLDNNKVACMYDKVTEQFFYNIGTGSFNAGKTLIDGDAQLLSLGNIELAKIGDYTDRIFKSSGKWWLEKNIGKIASYNGETITSAYISTTGGLDTGATVYYVLATPTTTEITDTTLIGQLNKLEAISLLRGYIYIYPEIASSNANPYIKLVYIKDLNIVVDELQSFNELLLDQVPIQQVSGDFINVQDSSNLPLKSFTPLGNATQDTNILTYKCDGMETGDYYFVYDNTNYQFTMPTISAGDILIFNTSTKKLYQGTIQITTTTSSTGTLITLSSTPNPDYPQDIHVVTGDNTFVKHNKNLVLPMTSGTLVGLNITVDNDGTTHISGTSTGVSQKYGATANILLKAGTYTLSTNTVSKTAILSNSSQIILQDINNNNIATINLWSATTKTFTLSQDTVVKRFYFYTGSNFTYDFTIAVQLEYGSTATPYEPYTEQTQLLSLGSIELAKIGDYTDRIFKAVQGNSVYDSLDSTTKASLTVGSWYKQNILKKVILNGSETVLNTTSVGTYYRHIISVDGVKNVAGSLSSHFKYQNSYTADNEHFYVGVDQIVIFDSNSTSQATKDWLEDNNVTFICLSATPTYTEITDTTLIEQLENILQMYTNKNVTNAWIEPSGDNAQAGMVLVYRQDLQTLTDKISSLEARVALLE
ncbi:MAG: hypothetical protein J6T10_25080 [Methanobrevibacter sp.]|nr:hypothetical protein [Methanobrevibacter sp.]